MIFLFIYQPFFIKDQTAKDFLEINQWQILIHRK